MACLGDLGGDELALIDVAEGEEEFGLIVEAVADPVKGGGEVFAEVSVVGAIAAQAYVLRQGEETVVGVGDVAHDFGGELAFEKFDEGADLAGAAGFEGVPFLRVEGGDGDGDLVAFGT